MRHALAPFGALAALALSGCLQILGLGDYTEGGGGTGGLGAGGAAASTTSSTVGSAGNGGCSPGEVTSCYEGPASTEGVGVCKGGTHVCQKDAMSFTACIDQVLPVTENCDLKGDEDCDGFSCSETRWVRVFGDPSDQVITAVAVDPSGNIFIGGQFSGAMMVGNTMLVASHGISDLFIAKLAADGTPLWGKAYGSPSVDYVLAIAADSLGPIVFGGSSTGQQVDFGGQPTGREFLARFDQAGNLAWSRGLAGAGSYIPNPPGALALDPMGNIFVGATLSGTVDCGGGNLPGSNTNDIVVAKFDPNGAHVWSHRYFGTSASDVSGVAIDFAGNPIFTGSISSTTDFQGSPLTATDRDPVLFKVKADGTSILFKKTLPGAGSSFASAIAVDSLGGPVIVGTIGGTLNAGPNANYDSAMGDMFVAKFGTTGSFGWARQLGTAADPKGLRAVTADNSGLVTVAGDVAGTIMIGTHVLTTSTTAAFVARFDTGGSPRWARLLVEGAETSSALGLAPNDKGQLVVGGAFKGPTVDFGLGSAAGLGGNDAFSMMVDP